MSSGSSGGTPAPEVDPIALPIALLALKTGYGYLPDGKTEKDCKEKAKTEGGLAWDEHAQACWKIFGKRVNIEADKDSIQEGFETVNFNFHATGNGGGAIPTSKDLSGPTTGLGSPGWSSDSLVSTGT